METGKIAVLQVFSLIICLAVAGFWDLRIRRIPNWWIGLWYIAGFGLFIIGYGWTAAFGYLVRSVATVGIFFLFFLCRMMGAGDIKCMALICGYLGFTSGFRVIGIGMLIGAGWSFAKLLFQKKLWERLSYLFAYFKQMFQEQKIIPYYQPERDGREITIPLACCFFCGLIVCVWTGFSYMRFIWLLG